MRQRDVDAFWSKVVVSPGCWIWQGAITPTGYGAFIWRRDGRRISSHAHRFAWELFHGPPNMSVLHRCDVRNCVNPDHLFLGTQAENVRDMCEKGRNVRKATHGYAWDIGENNPMAKLTNEAVRAMRAERQRGTPYKRIAEMFSDFGVSPGYVCRICVRQIWKDVQ